MSFEDSLRENVELAPMTTFKIGGLARYFAEISNTGELPEAVDWARNRGLPFFVLGDGSNVVIADNGFAGLVIRVSFREMSAHISGDRVELTVGAGEEWDDVVARCVSNNWAGFECLSGIPGRVGATPIQNVGAYGQEISETLISIGAFDIAAGKLMTLGASESEFGYRTSRFKTRDRGRFIITRVTYGLALGGAPSIRYPELQRYLSASETPTLSEVRDAVITLRRRKSMVIDPTDPNSRSAGSFFVNPILSQDEFESFKTRAREVMPTGEEIPAFPAANEMTKLSAAWLIERAGFSRGFVRGNVGTSTKHALAIINRANGTASEIVNLSEEIKARVRQVFGITLVVEPVFVGFN